MIRALCILLGCELAGEGLRLAAHLPVPGPVIGMLLLTAGLLVRSGMDRAESRASADASELAPLANGLISHMGLLFVPAGVGVIAQLAVLEAQWLPILAGLVGSTLVSLIVTAAILQRSLSGPASGRAAPVTAKAQS